MKIMKTFMQMKYACYLVILLFISPLQSLNAQTITDPGFDWCNGVPSATEVRDLNRFLAFTHAPVLVTLYSELKYDIPTTIDFDQNLNSLDNWENASSPDHEVSDASMYYAVAWTPELFIITYSLFYPRDYARSLCAARSDEHENDLERIIITVDRCSGSAGVITTHHGKNDVSRCISDSESLDVPSSETTNTSIQPGRHVRVYISPGSHAIYLSVEGAFDDPGFPLCKPDINGARAYYPIPNPVTADPDRPFNLIDIFDPVIGPWKERGNSNVFTTHYPPNQSFLGDNGGNKNAASAPWNGDFGLDPISAVEDRIGTICNLIEIDETSTYIYNPYLCDDYDLLFSKDAFCSVGDQIDARITRPSRKNASNILSTTWDYPDYVSCDGCSDNQPIVTFTLLSVPPTGRVNINGLVATTDCGVTIPTGGHLWANPTYVPFFINVLCVDEDNYVALDDLRAAGFEIEEITACNQNDPISVRLDRDRIFLRSDREQVFSLCAKVTSPCGELIELEWLVLFSRFCIREDVERSSSRNELSHHQSNNFEPSDKITIFPNPASEYVTIELMKNPQNPSSLITLLDASGKIVKVQPPSDTGQTRLDVSGLASGIYLVQIMGKKGMIATERFVKTQ